jgi:prepilin-type N-terminal cleavage/methylation domain-containing protein
MNVRSGFSLVELIVALSIFAMLSISILYVFGSELKLSKKISRMSEKQQLINTVMDRMARDIRAACAIHPSSDKNKLVLSVEADSIEYSIINEKVRRQKNSFSVYLTDTGEIKALSFAYPLARMVEVELDGSLNKFILRN